MTLLIVKVTGSNQLASLVAASACRVPDIVDLVEFVIRLGVCGAINVDGPSIGSLACVDLRLGRVSVLLILNTDGSTWRGIEDREAISLDRVLLRRSAHGHIIGDLIPCW